MILAIVFLIFQAGFAVLLFYLLIAFVIGAPFVPTTNPVASRMIALAQLKKGMTVVDLGSGDGRLVDLAKKEGAHAIGLEINPFLVLYSKMRRLNVQWKNFWVYNLSHADVLFVYLLPWRMDALEKKIQRECKKGTLVVSNSFMFPKLTLVRSDAKNHVFVYLL